MATRTRPWLPPSLGTGLLWIALSSCSAPPEPGESQSRVDDCLRGVNLDRLPALLQHCDAVVEAFPEHPQPRNERALLLKLAGKPQEACRDSLKAAALVKQGKHPVDALMRDEIDLRRRNCLRLTTDRAAAAPSAATAGDPTGSDPD